MNHEFGAVMPCWFTYTEEDRSQLILSVSCGAKLGGLFHYSL
ncbi:hypothetical protein V6Z11_A08G083300 [Gossypium hirsutum]